MKNYWDDGELYSQPSESLLKRNASDSLKKQKMKGKTMHPIIISSRKIARSWWGNAWCENLERYADYTSRLETWETVCTYRNGSGSADREGKDSGTCTGKAEGSGWLPYFWTMKEIVTELSVKNKNILSHVLT